jgi:hypothetical protein
VEGQEVVREPEGEVGDPFIFRKTTKNFPNFSKMLENLFRFLQHHSSPGDGSRRGKHIRAKVWEIPL